MSEERYKEEHLQEYTGILTGHNNHNGKFKMELKVEDNPVLERSIEKIESSIELEFYYNMGLSTLFYHDIHTCPSNYDPYPECHECKDIKDRHYKFEANLHQLQIGDTFKIKAALINGKLSELLVRIQSFKDYEPLTAACTEYSLRLDDTIEGINNKKEIEEQKLQREQERASNEEQAQKEAKRRKRKESIKQFLGKSPNTNQIIVTVIGTTIANQILPRIFKYIYRLFLSN